MIFMKLIFAPDVCLRLRLLLRFFVKRSPEPNILLMGCTYRLGNRDDLHAVKRQTADRPDDGMHLLLNVDGDRHDAAAVFTNSNTSEETMKSTMKTNIPTMR